MLTFSQMLVRLLVAIALGAIMGLEREMIGKAAGIRTTMLVAAGASIFTMISLEIPYLVNLSAEGSMNVLPDRVISNIVVGIGFLGAGIIIKTGEHVRGLTTAALVWTAAAIGTLVGLDFFAFAATSAITISGLLYLTRRTGISEKINPARRDNRDSLD